MYGKIMTGLLMLLVFLAPAANFGFAANVSGKDTTKEEKKIIEHAAKVKKGIKRLGIGTDSRVKVKLRNKKKVKGYVSEIRDEGFTVVDKKGEATAIRFDDTDKVEGKGISNGDWVLIGALSAGAIIAVVMLYIWKRG